MASVTKPFAFVDVSTWPFEHSIATHVALEPLTIIELSLVFGRVGLLWPFSLEEAFTLVFSIVPFASVATLAFVKDKIAVLAGFTVFEVTKVDLLEHILIIIIEDSDETCASRLAIMFRSVVNRAIVELFD